MATIYCPNCKETYSELEYECECGYVWTSDDHEELETRCDEEAADEWREVRRDRDE